MRFKMMATEPTHSPTRYLPARSQSQPESLLGELHVHTKESFDATLFGNLLGIEDAYRFAKGEVLKAPGGEPMQLSRPLDFVAITDHADGFGTRTHCGDGPPLIERQACRLVNTPNPRIFTTISNAVRGKPARPSEPPGVIKIKIKPQRFKAWRFPDLPVCIGSRPLPAIPRPIGNAMSGG